MKKINKKIVKAHFHYQGASCSVDGQSTGGMIDMFKEELIQNKEAIIENKHHLVNLLDMLLNKIRLEGKLNDENMMIWMSIVYKLSQLNILKENDDNGLKLIYSR